MQWAFLALMGAFSGCFETKLIPAESSAGGEGGALVGGEGGVSDSAGSAGVGEAGAAAAGGSASGGEPSAGSGGLATGGASNGKGGNVASGGVTTGGKSASGGASATGGVTASGGAATGGVVAASGGSGGLSKVDWLTFDGSDAPSSLGVNGALGINGVLREYVDSCATLTWNAATRCATGTLCEPANGANWGVAVGFDFKNTGPGGTPPDTTQLWNPNDVGALGVAWEITGTAPSFQVWVLNMDSIWRGQCSSATCEIAGPPDGVWSPPLAGQLLFANMQKDDWGGSGVRYEYDPAQVHALQFKLPAIIAGATSFSFCIKRVGIVR